MTNIEVILCFTLPGTAHAWGNRVPWFAWARAGLQKLSKQGASLQSAGREQTMSMSGRGSRDPRNYTELPRTCRGSRNARAGRRFQVLSAAGISQGTYFCVGDHRKVFIRPKLQSHWGLCIPGVGMGQSSDRCPPTLQQPKLQENPFFTQWPPSALYWESMMSCSL